MVYLTKAIATFLITVLMQMCAVGIVSSTPEEATQEFLSAFKAQDKKVMERYMDNYYVNFLCNTEGNQKTIAKMNNALFKNFSYEVLAVKQKNDVAVAKVLVTSGDFSGVMESYNKISYDYIMDNLYDENISDKEYLNKECLKLYVDEIEKAAETGATVENVVFIPMIDNGYYGWNIIMTDELMKSVIGNLQMPVE